MTIPIITQELLDWLQDLFPNTVPDGDEARDLYRAQGRQQVIRRLIVEHRNQNDPTYE